MIQFLGQQDDQGAFPSAQKSGSRARAIEPVSAFASRVVKSQRARSCGDNARAAARCAGTGIIERQVRRLLLDQETCTNGRLGPPPGFAPGRGPASLQRRGEAPAGCPRAR